MNKIDKTVEAVHTHTHTQYNLKDRKEVNLNE